MPGTLRILIIASVPDYILVTRALSDARMIARTERVDTRPALKEALNNSSWDLLLADHELPGATPEDGLKLLGASHIDIPLILLSRSTDKEKLAAQLRAGAHDYVNLENLYLLAPAIRKQLSEAAARRASRRHNSALFQGENRYRLLVENSPVAMILLQNQRIVYLNRAAKQTLHAEGDSALAHHRVEDLFVYPQQLSSLHQPQPGIATIQQPLHTSFRCLDGKLIQVEVLASQVVQQGETTTQLVFSDISQRMEVEVKLQQAAKVFEYTTEGVIITDGNANIIAVNRAFTEITGYPEDEVLGRNPRLLKSDKHDKAFYQALWETIERDGSWRGEIWNRRKNGESYPEWLTITSVQDDQGQIDHYVAVFSDITSIKQSQTQLEHLAHHDPLTDLPNRLLFEARLEHAITQAKRQNNHLAVLFLDLDRFKNINDSLGHAVGDELLKQVAGRILKLLREHDTAARLGGDEFTILVENLETPSLAALIAAKIQEQLKQPFEIFERKLHITASIGISLYPEDGENVVNLTKNADAAMYQAKEHGRNNYRFYTAELTQSALERLLLETELRTALKDMQLRLYYQPQYSIINGKMTGAEALLRWHHPRIGVIPPGRFIPLAEESGLIHEIGNWTLETACEQTRIWSQKGLFAGRMAVNLSVRQIMQTDLILRFEEIIEKTGCPPGQLQFEVTEGIFMGQKELSIPVLDVFKQLGVTIAIDDFGTGYSSLSYLKQLPIDKLKIDRSFIKDMPFDSDDAAITQAIISLGQTLGLEIIAEGVETQAQQELLRSMGCQEAQGFLYGQPMSSEEFEILLMGQDRLTRRGHPVYQN